jgi:Domain of unknown function (DUF4124)
MRTTPALAWAVGCGLLVAVATSVRGAEIYTWVDAQGRTHYSERKPGGAAVRTVVVSASPPPVPVTAPAAATTEDMLLIRRLLEQQNKAVLPAAAPAPAPPPRSLSGGLFDESTRGKCNLARDVLSGAVRHRNGAATDAYDRQIAESDIRLYCKR